MRRRASYALIAACAAATLPDLAFAQTADWSYSPAGGAWTATWRVNTNWNPPTAFPNSSTAEANLVAAPIGAASGTIVINAPGVTVNRLSFAATGTNSNGYTVAGAGLLMLPNGGTVDVATGGVGTLAGIVGTPAGSIIHKTGGGLLVLSGFGSFGNVTGISIDGGTLRVTRTGALPNTGAIAAHGDGQLELRNTNTTAALIFNASADAPNPNGTIYSSAGNNSWEGNWFVGAVNNSVGVIGGTTLTLLGNVISGGSFGPYGITKTGAGTFATTGMQLNGVVRINEGTMVLKAGPSNGNEITGLDIVGGPTPTARLDVTDSKLVVRGDSGSIVKAYLHAGANGGSWNGNGITSSIAEADAAAHGGTTSLAVGYARGDQLTNFNGSTASFGGSTVNPSDIAVTLTRAGDTDLDGDVDINADFAHFVSGYTAANSVLANVDWHSGDFNYDGVISLGTDFTYFANGFAGLGGSLPALSAAIGSSGLPLADQEVMQNIVATTPEPTGVTSILGFGSLLAARRRRRNTAGAVLRADAGVPKHAL